MAVMDIARPVPDIEYLAGLGDRTEQRVIAALILPFRIETNRAAFREAAGRQYRTIEVQHAPAQPEGSQSFANQFPIQRPQPIGAGCVQAGQGAAQGRRIQQPRQTKKPLDHWIVVIIAAIAQLAISEQQMDNQH